MISILRSKKVATPLFSVVLAYLLTTSCLIAQEETNNGTGKEPLEIAFLLFDDYETLDVFGPAEIFGRLTDHYILKFYSLEGGVITNRHRVPIMTEELSDLKKAPYVLLIPGGLGTRVAVNNADMIRQIQKLAPMSDYVLTVCTGSALLAKTGLLDGKKATSNKRAFSWVETQGEAVAWDKRSRWKIDGTYYTSSGVSAGMDMAFGFLADRHGIDFARSVAKEIEYHWIEDKDNDTFTAE
jgi:putative intracellular protease/amidase